LLARIFWQRQKTGGLDLEAVEMAVRSAMHQAGATALTQLLQFDPPGPDQRQLPCPCGHWAKYFGLRPKPLLTAVGEAQCLRPYYLCERCHQGQFPADVDLDIEDTELSPGVRRMLAVIQKEITADGCYVEVGQHRSRRFGRTMLTVLEVKKESRFKPREVSRNVVEDTS
jgi:hypothetical protein